MHDAMDSSVAQVFGVVDSVRRRWKWTRVLRGAAFVLAGTGDQLPRMIEHAAKQIGMDVAEIRRRNLIAPDKFPYETPTHYVYDSGEFVRLGARSCGTVGVIATLPS